MTEEHGNGNGNKVTVAELGRMVAVLTTNMASRFDEIRDQFDKYELAEITRERYKIVELRLRYNEDHNERLEERQSKLEEERKADKARSFVMLGGVLVALMGVAGSLILALIK